MRAGACKLLAEAVTDGRTVCVGSCTGRIGKGRGEMLGMGYLQVEGEGLRGNMVMSRREDQLGKKD